MFMTGTVTPFSIAFFVVLLNSKFIILMRIFEKIKADELIYCQIKNFKAKINYFRILYEILKSCFVFTLSILNAEKCLACSSSKKISIRRYNRMLIKNKKIKIL